MSLVNSSLLNVGGMSSNPAPETLPAGESGDLNQEFAQMLQYLRQGQDTKEQNQSKEDAPKSGSLQERSQEPEAPMKNLLGFLDAVEGQMAKDSGPKSSGANAALGVADKLSALAQFLKTFESKLTEDAALGTPDLEELASILEEVKAFFDQVTDVTQLPISSDQVKNLSQMSAGNEPGIIATVTSTSDGDDQSALLVIPEIKVDVDQETKSQSMIAKGPSNALSQLQALVRKAKSASNSNDAESLASVSDANKVASLLETIKGIDLNKLFTNSDKSTATVDIALDGTNQPIIDEFIAILNKVKSESTSPVAIVPDKAAQVAASGGNVADGPAPLTLPMRTSDVVFPSDNGKTSADIENLPEALSVTSGVLQQLKGANIAADKSGEVVVAGDKQNILGATTLASADIGDVDAIAAVKTKVGVDTTPVTEVKNDAKVITAIGSDQAAVSGTKTSPVEGPSRAIDTDPVSIAKTIEVSGPSTPQQLAAKEIVAPLVSSEENIAPDSQVSDLAEIKAHAVTGKASLKKVVQSVEELPAASVRLNTGPTAETTMTEALDGAAETVPVATPGKVENTETVQAAVKTAVMQDKAADVMQAAKVATKDPSSATESKIEKPVASDVKEVKPEATLNKSDGTDVFPKAEAGKVEAKLTTTQDKLATGDTQKNNGDLEKDFAKMLGKVALSKQSSSGQKGQQAEVAEKFNIEPPKIRPLAVGHNTPLYTKAVTDFVGRTAQAFVSQQQGIARKKLTAETPTAAPAASMTAEAASSQQVAASSGSQSQTGQGSSGPNMLERWADSHLDLSSRGWATNMAKTMVSALNRGQERLMFSLSPPSLGRISIAFTSTRGALDVRIQAERKATIALLGDSEGKLTSNLESAGHRVNSLSYAEMNAGETNFYFDHNQSSNDENKGKDKSDSSKAEKSTSLEAEAEKSTVSNKKTDDSLVNITV